MSDLVQIIRRELLERKMLMIGSLAIGAMILLTAFAPGNPPIPGIWNVLSMWWSIITLLGLSVYAGSSFVASELRENRFTFYLARPVSIRTLWAGKMIAAWLLSLICAFLIVVPVTLTGNGLVLLFTQADEGNALSMLALLGAALVLVVAGHAGGVILRARSAWLLLDFIAISVASLVFTFALRPLFMSFAFGLTSTLAGLSVVLLAAMLAVAGYLGLQSGRTDIARVHRMTSIATAIALIVTAASVALYSWNVRSTGPDELRTVDVQLECGTLECNPAFTGSARGLGDFSPYFTAVGVSAIPMPMPVMAGNEPGGNWVVWASPTRALNPEFDFFFLSPSSGKPRSLGLELSWSAIYTFALEGDRLAFLADDNLTVIDLKNDQIVRSMRVEGAGGAELDFEDPNHLLVFSKEGGGQLKSGRRILEIDIEEGRIQETGSFVTLAFWRDDDALVSQLGSKWRALDPRTGSVLVQRDADDLVIAGSRAIFEIRSAPTALEITDLEGDTIREILLPDASDAIMGETVADGRLAVAVRRSGRFGRENRLGSRLLLVNLETGASEEVATDLVPARFANKRVRGPWYLEALPDDRSRLVRFEPGR